MENVSACLAHVATIGPHWPPLDPIAFPFAQIGPIGTHWPPLAPLEPIGTVATPGSIACMF